MGGFVRESSSDSYVLLGGGGHKLISDFAGASHSHSQYLPLSGGTMSGSIHFVNHNHGVSFSPGDPNKIGSIAWNSDLNGIHIDCHPNLWLDSENVWVEGSVAAASFIKDGGTSSQFLKADGSVDSSQYLPLSGGTITGDLTVNQHLSVHDLNVHELTATTISAAAFVVNGGTSSQFLKADGSVDSKKYLPLSGGTMTGNINMQSKKINFSYSSNGGNIFADSTGFNIQASAVHISTESGSTLYGSLSMTNGNLSLSQGNLTVGGKLLLPELKITYSSSTPATTFDFTDYQDVYFIGTPYVSFNDADVYAVSFNQTSDLRKKNVVGDVLLNIYNVANAPLFKFTWKEEKKSSREHIGSSAQYWQTVLPELVSIGKDEMHTLGIQYDVIALASAITVAKKTVEHEQKISYLESQITQLRNEILNLKNIDSN